MRAAQHLYEGIDLGSEGATGLITYMRTDSIRIGDEAKGQAHNFIEHAFGKEYIGFGGAAAKSSKNAQDAHEAIRPTSVNRRPEDLKPYLTPDQYRLYDLIWKRFVAAMMAPGKIEQTRVDIGDPDAPYLVQG